jgi:hypothetical protein
MTIGVYNEVGDSSLDCQSYLTFVIEVVGTLGLSTGANITWNEITPGSIDEPITTGIVQKLACPRMEVAAELEQSLLHSYRGGARERSLEGIAEP